MASSLCPDQTLLAVLVVCLLVPSCPTSSSSTNQTFHPAQAHKKMKFIQEHLRKINKPPQKTIKSPDGDIIDCVLFHNQPAFDHPLHDGQIQTEPSKTPKGYKPRHGKDEEHFQLWSATGEKCPDGTIPIRRTTEADLLRTSAVGNFGRRNPKLVKRDSNSNGHEHAVGYTSGNQYFGAKASINVWSPRVKNQNEFSIAQIWIISGSFGKDLNTIEAGWLVSPELYGDNFPRFFTYWTTDAYQATGCYNLLCSGFVQTSNRIAVGAAISPVSSYNGRQFDITLLIWKDPKHGHWWLQFGSNTLVGYWPSYLFSHLNSHATMVQFGGEVVNTRPSGFHTSTQMGSGHFAREGFGRASYFRNLQVVDWDNNLVPSYNLKLLADRSSCYDVRGGRNRAWGNYFYYGGPGRNVRCP